MVSDRKSKKTEKNKQQKESSLSEKIFSPPYAYFIIWTVLLIVYGQVLTFYLGKFDEEGIILSNLEFLKDFGNINQAFFRDAFFSNKGVEFYRPLQNISFMLDAHLSGAAGWGYYLMNLLLHGLTCCLIYNLFSLFDFNRKLALAITLIFAVNPLFAHLIAWAPSRGDLLIGLFGVLSYIYFRKYILTGRLVFLLINFFAFLLALLSKESAIVFPLIFILDFFLIEKNYRAHIKKLIFALTLCLLVIIFYFILRFSVVRTETSSQVFGLMPFLHNLQVILEYAGKFVFPLFLSPMPSYSFINTSLGILVFASIGWTLFKYRPAYYKTFIFCFLWYLLFIVPGMMYTHEYGSDAYDYLEHRAYLPLMGFVLFLYLFGIELQKQSRTSVFNYLLFLLTVFYGIGTFFYVKNYENPQIFYNLAVRTNPNSAMAFNNRGLVSSSFKDFQSAIENYNQALKIKPDYAEAYVNRGMCYFQMRDTNSALADYSAAIDIKPTLFQAHYNLANLKFDMKNYNDALKEYNIALKINPYYYQGYIVRGSLLFKQNDYQAAIRDFSLAISYNASSDEAFVNRGKCRYLTKDTTGACSDWKKALGLGSKDAKSLIDSYCK
jgi:tetratricopeptide (TPR) repeat protein